MIPCARARHVEKVALRVVDVFKIGVVGDRFDALLQRDHLVVASHHDDGPELEAFREMHRADGHATHTRLNTVVQHLGFKTGVLDCCASPIELRCGANEDADLVS